MEIIISLNIAGHGQSKFFKCVIFCHRRMAKSLGRHRQLPQQGGEVRSLPRRNHHRSVGPAFIVDINEAVAPHVSL